MIQKMSDTALYRSRQRANLIGLTLSMFAMFLGLAALLWILFVLFSNGFAALDVTLFTNDTPAPGSEGGGIRNAIVGSLMIVGLSVLISTPLGVLAGIYLTEYGDTSKTAEFTRNVTDIMLSAPSIVLGLFVYAIAVAPVGHFSGYAGSLALSLIAIPVVMRTTENMLRLVPGSLREAAFALGAPRWKVSLMVTLRAAQSGVITGVLLAIARISGETAPLLFTALNNQFFSTNMEAPMANLPVVIFQFAMSPYQNWIQLAWGAALLITLTVLLLNILARVFFREKVICFILSHRKQVKIGPIISKNKKIILI
jgi:phosphate transport system permease protein